MNDKNQRPSRAGIFALGGKVGAKALPWLLKLFKLMKLGKVTLAALSIASYAYMFTWRFSLALAVALFVHESGHIWAMKRYGLRTKGIYFIPFLGAAAVSKDSFPSRNAEAVIAIAGPIWGGALAAAAALFYLMTRIPEVAAMASMTAMINLFNLLPINPLDGGRIVKSIVYSSPDRYTGMLFLSAGMFLSMGLALMGGFAIFFVLTLAGGIEVAVEWKRAQPLAAMTRREICRSTILLVGTATALALLMAAAALAPGADVAITLLRG